MSRVSIDKTRLPRHIAIIMDGNGRWAQARGRPRVAGHRAGSKAVRRVVRACRRMGIEALTLYAFSVQNWGRPEEEVSNLMELLGEFIIREWQEIMDQEIRVVHLGELRRVPLSVREKLLALERASRHHRGMTLALALSYGSREEMVRATRKMVGKALAGKLSRQQVTEARLAECLDTASLPDPDLLIRTGGERRLSNFLLWQSAYAELVFSDILWPDFMQADLRAVVAEFQRRNRRYGLTGEQAGEG